ncbi:carbohydrate ABC transporter permease [Aggregatilinea lenta]|uniref:carbohydrate ABC transporter permease n=1 Tax=Aggregatilinea lenta TaxID=913108 RepID=UPI000E5B155D|nr:sugar ABC transporter permease [Aggregatilinea lenta]
MAKRKFNIAPYLLILPSFIYLVLFFAWPMGRSLQLAFQKDAEILPVRTAVGDDMDVVGYLPMQIEVAITDRERSEETLPNGRTRPVYWFKIAGESEEGEQVEGWVNQKYLQVQSRTESTSARVVSGEGTQEWTLDYVKRMVNDHNFMDALTTTLILLVLILPIQFALAITMALVLQARLKGSTIFLYIYAIPLGISDLAAGLVWVNIFTQHGFLNTFLQRLGIIDSPYIFLSAENKHWMIVAIVLAEVWRATSIVMVIVVSGLQSIPDEYLEAGQLFGASLWQRLRHIILPLLRPSLQVALILRTILAFQVFAVVVALTGGRVITVLAYETYRWYDPGDSGFNNPHVAAAYAGFIMLISLVFSVVYLRTVRTQEQGAST